MGYTRGSQFYIHAICNVTFMQYNMKHVKNDRDTILEQYRKITYAICIVD